MKPNHVFPARSHSWTELDFVRNEFLAFCHFFLLPMNSTLFQLRIKLINHLAAFWPFFWRLPFWMRINVSRVNPNWSVVPTHYYHFDMSLTQKQLNLKSHTHTHTPLSHIDFHCLFPFHIFIISSCHLFRCSIFLFVLKFTVKIHIEQWTFFRLYFVWIIRFIVWFLVVAHLGTEKHWFESRKFHLIFTFSTRFLIH